jgi:hypothetical protein
MGGGIVMLITTIILLVASHQPKVPEAACPAANLCACAISHVNVGDNQVGYMDPNSVPKQRAYERQAYTLPSYA